MMQEPFDIEFENIIYAVFPEEDNTYTIFKNGIEYIKIQKDTEAIWLRLDPDTDTPLFEANAEANLLGKLISEYTPEEEDDEDNDD